MGGCKDMVRVGAMGGVYTKCMGEDPWLGKDMGEGGCHDHPLPHSIPQPTSEPRVGAKTWVTVGSMGGYRLGVGLRAQWWCKDMGKGGGHGWGTD